MAGLCEGDNERQGSLKAVSKGVQTVARETKRKIHMSTTFLIPLSRDIFDPGGQTVYYFLSLISIGPFKASPVGGDQRRADHVSNCDEVSFWEQNQWGEA
ncbi:hypothetical protein ANN_04785 [Periplaneta americana]|uniref:Uncharacterized protein n=1 Tax=Periplaneta americana TaxID=6978 RepID=A0ABQ8TBB5_PERAM|nr:hypothetical protein ANN_04785 [Periplaneta americana]